MSIPDHLITPLDWSAEALRHAKWAGQPARDRALIESKRYLATHELIERLRAELAQAREVLQCAKSALEVAISRVPTLRVKGPREAIDAAISYSSAVGAIDAALAAKE